MFIQKFSYFLYISYKISQRSLERVSSSYKMGIVEVETELYWTIFLKTEMITENSVIF